MEIVYDPTNNFIGHGFLAVDFFFCLSGFVIAYAYDDRIKAMGLLEFVKARLIRLHPLVFLGALLGLLSFLFDPFATYQAVYGAGQVALLFLASIFLVPYPVMEERYFNLFGLNAPTWSLFWEYAASILYVSVLYKVGKRSLLILILLSAGLVFFVAYRSGNLLGGWSGDTFWDGAVRVSYSFMAGLFIYRSKWVIKNKLGFWGLGIMLLLAFLLPYSGWNWLLEPLIVVLYFPLLIALGAGTSISGRLENVCKFSGDISYPLYMTHYMAMFIFLNYYTLYKPDTIRVTFIIVTGTILLIGFAYLVMVVYDIPMRKYLNRKKVVANN